jgi:excisionase family DNA binding protein
VAVPTNQEEPLVFDKLDKLFYKPDEAAAKLSRGRTKVFAAMATGELRSVRIGRSRLIPANALLDYAERLARGEVTE